MSNESLPGNPHCHDAAAAGRYYELRRLDRDADVIALAQVEATLALAYEQRTANLIAQMALSIQAIQASGITMSGTNSDFDAVHGTVMARLGLDEVQA